MNMIKKVTEIIFVGIFLLSVIYNLFLQAFFSLTVELVSFAAIAISLLILKLMSKSRGK